MRAVVAARLEVRSLPTQKNPGSNQQIIFLFVIYCRRTYLSKEKEASNQCEQMARLFFHIWPFTTIQFFEIE